MPDQVSAPAQYDFDIWRGSNQPALVFLPKHADGEPEDITGYDFVFMCRTGRGTTIEHSIESGGLVVDSESGQITYAPSIEESRAYSLGKTNSYAIERRAPDGTQSPYLYGAINAKDYVNGDV